MYLQQELVTCILDLFISFHKQDSDATLLVTDIVDLVYLFGVRVRRGDETIALAEDGRVLASTNGIH